MTNKVILLLCGSFNPITFMHLRMFEVARDYFHENNLAEIIGGIISPVNDAYPKKDLLPASYRCEMAIKAVEDNSFLIVDDWESKQNEWCRTKIVLETTQKRLKNELYDSFSNISMNKKSRFSKNTENKSQKWIQDINFREEFRVHLLCGADLLESFAVPDLWSVEDMKSIIKEHGLAVISRESTSPETFIYENDILHKYKRNIHIIQNWMGTNISSTKIRRALKRRQSVKYFIPDTVIDYIKEHKLYTESSND